MLNSGLRRPWQVPKVGIEGAFSLFFLSHRSEIRMHMLRQAAEAHEVGLISNHIQVTFVYLSLTNQIIFFVPFIALQIFCP